MATKNLIPRASGEGKLGVRGDTNYLWKEVNAVSGSYDQVLNNDGNDLLSQGTGITINHASGSSGFQYTISATATSISSINDIADVNTSGVANGQHLIWDSASSTWSPATPTTGDITGVTAGTGLTGGGISGDVTLNVSGLTVDELAAGSLQTSGESFADNDTSLMTSAAINDLIDAAVQGLDVKDSVRVATTGVLSGFTYDVATQQWQEDGSTGALSIDGVDLADGDRVLVKDAAAATQNGIYVMSGIDGSSQVILDRSEDLDNGSDFRGVFTFVEEGNTNVTRGFVAKNASTPASTTVGSNTQNWSQFSSAGSVSALNDLSDVSYSAGPGIDNYVLTYDHSTTSWGAEAASAPVTSVNGDTGAVVLSGDDLTADHSASNYTATNANIDGHLSGIDTKFGTLGTASTQDVGTTANDVVQLDGAAKLPAIDGSQLINLPSAPVTSVNGSTGVVVLSSNNLSDVTITAAADSEYLRYNGAAWVDAALSILDDTSPQLGGNLDTNNKEIRSATNENVIIRPDGTGAVHIGGNTNPAEIRLYCEVSDNHYVGLASPAHAALSGSTVWTLPTADGNADQVLKTNGSGQLSFVDQASGGGSRPAVAVVTSQTSVVAPADDEVLEMIYIYNSTNVITTTLPDITSTAAITEGFKYQLKNINTGAVTVNAASGEHIDHSGQTSITINQYDNYTLTTDGNNWYII